MIALWIVSFIVLWILIFGGKMHVKWTRRESMTFTISLHSPRKKSKQDIETTEQPRGESSEAV